MTHAGDDGGTMVRPLDAPAPPLPLPAGLIALADEMSTGSAVLPLERLAAEVQRGRPLSDAAADSNLGLPRELSELLLAGTASGQLMAVAQRYSVLIRRRRAFRRELSLLMLYPTVLVGTLLGVGMMNWLIFRPMYTSLVNEFNLPNIGWMASLAWLLGPGLGIQAGILAAVILLLALTWPIGGRRAAHVLRQIVPLLGPVYRYQSASEFADLLGLLVRFGLPLPRALRSTALGMSDAVCASAVDRLADAVERGFSLGESLDARHSMLSPMAPLLSYGEQHGVLPDALDALAEMYAGRSEVQANVLRMTVPPILVLSVAALAALMLLVLILPLFQLIVTLT